MSNANRSQWLFPKNEVGKVIGWSDEASPSNPNASKGLVNLDYVGLDDLAGKQDASANLTTLAGITPGAAGQAILAHAAASDTWDYVSETSAFNQAETGSGWANQATAARIHRVNDRLFVGKGATDYDGITPGAGGTGGWLMDEHGYYLMANATMAGLAEADGSKVPYGVLGAAKSPTGYNAGVIGLAGYASVAGLRGWAGYLEAVKQADVGVATGTTFGLEIDATNLDDGSYGNPHPGQSAFGGGQVGALVLAAGGGQAGAFNAQFALGISDNQAKFQRGIVFLESALVPDASTDLMHAIVLPRKGVVDWAEDTTNTLAMSIYSDISDSTHKQALRFSDSGMTLFNAAGKFMFSIPWTANSVNYVQITPQVTGGSPTIAVAGDDTNIHLTLDPKGTSGRVRLRGNGVSQIQVDSTGIGFFNTTPVAKPTGVAVTAAGIHAALVTLGLIAA